MKNSLLAGVTLVVFFGGQGVAFGQTPPPAPEPAMVTPSTDSTIGDIVVTAQRRSESLARTPIAITAVSSDTLAKQSIRSESDLQTSVPGLTVKAAQSSNQLNYSLRGQSVDAFTSSRPSVLPYFNEVQVGGSGSTSFYDLQSVQVLKGPQGTLFGRNATGGAVLFTSAKPTNEVEGYIAARGGNYGDTQAEGAFNIPIVNDTVLLRIAGFFQRRDGFQYNLFTGSRVGNVRRENIRASLTLKPTSGLTNDLVVDYGHSGGNNTIGVAYNIGTFPTPFVPANYLYTPAFPGFAAFLTAHPRADPQGIIAFVAKQQQRGPFIVDTDAPNSHKSKALVVSNITEIDLGGGTKFKNIIGYVHRKATDTGDFDGTPFPVDSNGSIGRGGPLTQYSEEAQILGDVFNGAVNYVAGVYFSDEREHVTSAAEFVDLLPISPPNLQVNEGIQKNRTYAGYGQATLKIGDLIGVNGLSVVGGLRYSSEKVSLLHTGRDPYIAAPIPQYQFFLSNTFKKVSWQVGINEQVNSNLLVYGVSRRSFRSGGFNFFAPPLPGFGNDGGSQYRPETATDVEIGGKYQGYVAGARFRINLAAYTMTITNVQRVNYVQVLGSLAGITVNVPEARVRGIELDSTISPTNWLNIGGALTYTDAKFTKDQVSVLGNPAVSFSTYPDTPGWSGSVFIEGTADLGSLLKGSLRADGYAQTSSYFSSTGKTLNPGTQISGYFVANFRAGVDVKESGLSFAVNLKNAFNRTYYVGGIGFTSLFSTNTVVPGDPRTILGEVRFRF